MKYTDVKLKPCPFCGNEAILTTGGEHFVIPECTECGAKLPASFGTTREAKATAAWNRRPVIEWLSHDDSDTWECTACHACFDLDSGTPKDKYLNYCPVCGTKLELPD